MSTNQTLSTSDPTRGLDIAPNVTSGDVNIADNVTTGNIKICNNLTSGKLDVCTSTTRTTNINIGGIGSTGNIVVEGHRTQSNLNIDLNKVRILNDSNALGPGEGCLQLFGGMSAVENLYLEKNIIIGQDIRVIDPTRNTNLMNNLTTGNYTICGTMSSGSVIIAPTMTSGNITVGNAAQTGRFIMACDSLGKEIEATEGFKKDVINGVTQTGGVTSGVTLNERHGTITTVSLTISPNNQQTFTVTNSYVVSTSVISTCISFYSGNGFPYAYVSAVTSGSFDITINNPGNLGSLNSTAEIYFHVVN